MKARELIPWLVAAEALTISLLVVVFLAMLSYRRLLQDIFDMMQAARRASTFVRDETTKQLPR